MITADEIRAALREMKIIPTEAAFEFDITIRTIYRWLDDGTDGTGEAALRNALRLARIGVAWRKNSVAIAIGADGHITALTDEEAACRHRDTKPLLARW